MNGSHVPWCGGGHEGQCAPITLCGTPDGTEKTLREWDALAAQRGPKTPLGERLVALIHCGACLRFRWNPGHWFSCVYLQQGAETARLYAAAWERTKQPKSEAPKQAGASLNE